MSTLHGTTSSLGRVTYGCSSSNTWRHIRVALVRVFACVCVCVCGCHFICPLFLACHRLHVCVCMQGIPYVLPLWPWLRDHILMLMMQDKWGVCPVAQAVHACLSERRKRGRGGGAAHAWDAVWLKNVLAKCYRVISAACGELPPLLQKILVL